MRVKKLRCDGPEVSADPDRTWYALLEERGPGDWYVSVYHPRDTPRDTPIAACACSSERDCLLELVDHNWILRASNPQWLPDDWEPAPPDGRGLLLYYRFDQPHETGNNQATAELATYQEAVATVREVLEDRHPGEYTLPRLPETATSLYFVDASHEDWRGIALVWGKEPRFCMAGLPHHIVLRVDDTDYDPVANDD